MATLTVCLLIALHLLGVAKACKARNLSIPRKVINDQQCYVLENDKAIFGFSAESLELVCIEDKALGISYIQPNGGSLFALTLECKNASDSNTPITSNMAHQRAAEYHRTSKDAKLILHFVDCRPQNSDVGVDVTISVALGSHDSVASWQISITPKKPIAVAALVFPLISGIGTSASRIPANEYIAVPYYGGTRRNDPRHNLVCNDSWTNYPGGGMTIQMLSYSDGVGKGSLYLASYDQNGYVKAFSCEPDTTGNSFHWSITHYTETPLMNGTWSVPYAVMCGPITGDWYDAAKRYREWARTNPNWQPLSISKKPYSKWFRNTAIWNSGIYGLPNCSVDWLTRFARRTGVTTAYHWYCWQHDRRHDTNYPAYFPAQPGFRETVKQLDRNSVYSVPYLNMQLFETQLLMWKRLNAQAWALRDAKGEVVPYTALWDTPAGDPKYPGEVHKTVPMCRGSVKWQDFAVNMYVKSIRDYEVDGVYLDELVTQPTLCYAKAHGHAHIGGNYHAEGTRKIIQRIRDEACKKDLAIFGEHHHEYYVGSIDGFLTGHSDIYDPPYGLPMFQSIMKDFTIEIGVFMTAEESRRMSTFAGKMGFCFVRGRQLGWFGRHNVDMLDPVCEKQLEFMTTLAKFRMANLDFLMYGEFLRPVSSDLVPMHTDTWESMLWNQPKSIPVPDVFIQPYRSPKGDIGIVMVNVTDHAIKLTLPINHADWKLPRGRELFSSQYEEGRWSAKRVINPSAPLEIAVEAYQPKLLRLQSV